jgi:hypothetical protein
MAAADPTFARKYLKSSGMLSSFVDGCVEGTVNLVTVV